MVAEIAKGIKYNAAKRMKEVERFYSNGSPARVIHGKIGKKYGVGIGTIRHDIMVIRGMWKDEITEFKSEPGAADWFFKNAMGDRIRAIAAKDLRTAYMILKDIGQITGAVGPDVQRVQVTTEDAKKLIDHVGAVLAEELADQPEVLERVLARIEKREGA